MNNSNKEVKQMRLEKKKLNRLSDIPSWFDIRKYDNALSYGLKEWHEQIKARSELYDFIEIETNYNKMTSIDAIKNWENLMKTYPIFEKNDDKVLEMLKYFDNIDFRENTTESVRDFSASDLKNINQAIDFDDELSSYCKNSMSKEMQLNVKTAVNLGKTSILLHKNVCNFISQKAVALTVNLEVTDEQLVIEFKSWLKLARTNFNCHATEEMFTSNDFSKWCEYAVLPYFDLTTWAALHGKEVTQDLMAEVLFPDALKPLDPLKKPFGRGPRTARETRIRSAQIFNRNTVNAMYAQVQIITKNNKK